MGSVVWFMLVFSLATAIVVSSARDVIHLNTLAPDNTLENDINQTIETSTKPDFADRIVQELRQDVQEQQRITSENQLQLNQSFVLLAKIQQEMLKQRQEVAKNQDDFSKWKAESQNATTELRIKQEQSFDLLHKMQQEMQKQQDEIAKDRDEFSKLHARSQEAIADILVKQENNSEILNELSTDLSYLKWELARQREEANEHLRKTESVNDVLNIHINTYKSCKEAPVTWSRKYNIRVNKNVAPFEAFCIQEQMGGGWMEIQFRSDGTVDFNRNWTDYKNGFGDPQAENWIGLEKIYQFTKEYNCELLVQMKDFQDNEKYARYDAFAIGSEAEGYYLKTLGAHSGSAGDSLRYHVGSKFSTGDRDNDASDGNCANDFKGGWWFNDCHQALLNGLHRDVDGKQEDHMVWYGFNIDWRGLSHSRMMIRPLD